MFMSKLSEICGIDGEYLRLYLEVCGRNAATGYYERHHVLPKSIFPEYESFSRNPWNLVNLSWEDHCIAHYYFAMAVDGCDLRVSSSAWLSVHAMLELSSTQNRNVSLDEIKRISGSLAHCREKMRESAIHIHNQDEVRLKKSDAMKKLIASPSGAKVHQLAATKAWDGRDDRKSMLSSRMKEYHSNASNKTTHSNSVKAGKRKGKPIWNELYDELLELWISTKDANGNRLKVANFTNFVNTFDKYKQYNLVRGKMTGLVGHFEKEYN